MGVRTVMEWTLERAEKLKIQRILRQYSSSGIKAKEIEKLTGIAKSDINGYLHANRGAFFQQSNDYTWTVCTQSAETDPFMLKLQNREDAGLFTLDEFNEIADWRYGASHCSEDGKEPAAEYHTEKGNIIECDSNYEERLLRYLEERSLVKALGGQNLCIPYDREFMTDCSYYPDIAALTWDDHIVIIEVKPVTHMSNYMVMAKYDALEDYCIENGYMYVMIDPEKKKTFEDLRNMDPPYRKLWDYFEDGGSWLQPSEAIKEVFFDDETVDSWYRRLFGDHSRGKGEFRLQVHAMIALYGWYNKAEYGGFQVYNHPVK